MIYDMIVLESDYAECLSMLMRYPPTSDAEVLIDQAIYLRDHLTPEGGAHIIKKNALRKGKPFPVLIPSSKEPPKIEGFVQEGFVHITKNVLESRGAKAILNEVKVSGRTYLEMEMLTFFNYNDNRMRFLHIFNRLTFRIHLETS
jgi:hypothetical protein